MTVKILKIFDYDNSSVTPCDITAIKDRVNNSKYKEDRFIEWQHLLRFLVVLGEAHDSKE